MMSDEALVEFEDCALTLRRNGPFYCKSHTGPEFKRIRILQEFGHACGCAAALNKLRRYSARDGRLSYSTYPGDLYTRYVMNSGINSDMYVGFFKLANRLLNRYRRTLRKKAAYQPHANKRFAETPPPFDAGTLHKALLNRGWDDAGSVRTNLGKHWLCVEVMGVKLGINANKKDQQDHPFYFRLRSFSRAVATEREYLYRRLVTFEQVLGVLEVLLLHLALREKALPNPGTRVSQAANVDELVARRERQRRVFNVLLERYGSPELVFSHLSPRHVALFTDASLKELGAEAELFCENESVELKY